MGWQRPWLTAAGFVCALVVGLSSAMMAPRKDMEEEAIARAMRAEEAQLMRQFYSQLPSYSTSSASVSSPDADLQRIAIIIPSQLSSAAVGDERTMLEEKTRNKQRKRVRKLPHRRLRYYSSSASSSSAASSSASSSAEEEQQQHAPASLSLLDPSADYEDVWPENISAYPPPSAPLPPPPEPQHSTSPRHHHHHHHHRHQHLPLPPHHHRHAVPAAPTPPAAEEVVAPSAAANRSSPNQIESVVETPPHHYTDPPYPHLAYMPDENAPERKPLASGVDVDASEQIVGRTGASGSLYNLLNYLNGSPSASWPLSSSSAFSASLMSPPEPPSAPPSALYPPAKRIPFYYASISLAAYKEFTDLVSSARALFTKSYLRKRMLMWAQRYGAKEFEEDLLAAEAAQRAFNQQAMANLAGETLQMFTKIVTLYDDASLTQKEECDAINAVYRAMPDVSRILVATLDPRFSSKEMCMASRWLIVPPPSSYDGSSASCTTCSPFSVSSYQAPCMSCQQSSSVSSSASSSSSSYPPPPPPPSACFGGCGGGVSGGATGSGAPCGGSAGDCPWSSMDAMPTIASY